ncbi:rubredoxin-like domain-containing protein [Desulfofundulus salinus]|uniref:Rubredoxin n=1 Tax=Desulfofundulus salinus TaxID=2419843 RepID=A0A494X441_9FIRM|nr:rubredoxin [Desulfofundulus salinum]RKO67935.1 rubredoxin [Desulfofundulus salinum]
MKWRCGVCGYIHDGDQPPEKCPKCGAPREKFTQLTDEEARLIDRSRYSNNLHAKLIALMQKVEALADEGIKDNLDPGCLTMFQAAKKQAQILAQMARAEIQTHISKGKWG